MEKKRYWRTFAAVINGKSVAEAIREGLIEETSDVDDSVVEAMDDDNGMFFPEKPTVTGTTTDRLGLDPTLPVFKPAETTSPSVFKPAQSFSFGQPGPQTNLGGTQVNLSPFSNPFGTSSTVNQGPSKLGAFSFGQPSSQTTAPLSNQGLSKPGPFNFGQPSSQTAEMPKESTKSGGFNFGQENTQNKAPAVNQEPSKVGSSIFGQPSSQTTEVPKEADKQLSNHLGLPKSESTIEASKGPFRFGESSFASREQGAAQSPFSGFSQTPAPSLSGNVPSKSGQTLNPPKPIGKSKIFLYLKLKLDAK